MLCMLPQYVYFPTGLIYKQNDIIYNTSINSSWYNMNTLIYDSV